MTEHLSKNKIIPFAYFFLFFMGVASFAPFIVLYYQGLGFSGAQIGLLTGIPPLITLFTVPMWTGAADRSNRHRLIMSISLLVAAGCVLIYPSLSTFPAVLAMTMMLNLFLGPSLSLANSATMYMLGEEKEIFGRLRVGGTLGFGVATLSAGVLVEQFSLTIAFWMAAAFFFCTFLVSLQLEYEQETLEEDEEGGRLSDLALRPEWALLLLLGFIGGVAMAAYNGYFFPYLNELGAGESAMGLAMAIGILGEIPVMLLADRFLVRFGGYGTLIFSTAITGLRLILFGLTESALSVMLIQLLHGMSTPLFLLAGAFYADNHAPHGLRTTSQGVFNSVVMGLGSAVGGFICGILLVRLGAQSLYLAIGLAVMVVMTIAIVFRGRLPVPAENRGL